MKAISVTDDVYDRLKSIADEEGDPVLHPETGLAMIEDDGC